ncbi:hypothetical protein Tco_1136374 [Tanacetum coccineum]
MVESEKPSKKKDQVKADEQLAKRLEEEMQAELEEEARIERIAQEEASIAALTAEFDVVQARMDVDALLAAKLQEEEREQFSIDEQARFLVETIAERKRFFAAQRAEQIRNKPPTRAQLRNKMVTYLKHMGKYTHNQLKIKSLEEIQKLYEREQKWIKDFVPMDSEVVGSSAEKGVGSRKKTLARKRTGGKDSEESVKKHKLEDETEKEELKAYLDIVPGDEMYMEVESLATKYPIVDWKTHILSENMMYYQIIRADGSSKNYKIFSEMLDDFDRQDVMDLHRLVQERYDTTSPEGYDLLLWGDLKILFEPNEEDEIWKNQQDYNLISWRLFDSCGVHVLLMNTRIAIHMMIEKKYPLTQEMLSRMLSRRLEVDHESEMAFELLSLRVIRSIHGDPTVIFEDDISIVLLLDLILLITVEKLLDEERKSLALKAKKESSDEECLTSGSKDEEYAMAVKDFKKFFKKKKCFRCGDPNHLIGAYTKLPRDQEQRAFVGGSWRITVEEDVKRLKIRNMSHDSRILQVWMPLVFTSVSDEDANHKFLRSLPPAWDSLAMTMRTKKNIDTLSIDDLYNNLSVFEQDIQKTSSSSLASDNVLFITCQSLFKHHKPSQAQEVIVRYTTSSSQSKKPTVTPGRADEVIHSFLATNADDIKKFTRKQAGRPRVDGKKCMWHLIREKLNVQLQQYWAFCGGAYLKVQRSDLLGRAGLNFINALQANDGELGTMFNANSTVYSSCQSNDSDGDQGTISDHTVQDNPTNIPSIEQDHPLKHMEHRVFLIVDILATMTGLYSGWLRTLLATHSCLPLFGQKQSILLAIPSTGFKTEVIDIDVQTERGWTSMVVSSTSLSEKLATKKTHSQGTIFLHNITSLLEDIMTFRNELDALCFKHLGTIDSQCSSQVKSLEIPIHLFRLEASQEIAEAHALSQKLWKMERWVKLCRKLLHVKHSTQSMGFWLNLPNGLSQGIEASRGYVSQPPGFVDLNIYKGFIGGQSLYGLQPRLLELDTQKDIMLDSGLEILKKFDLVHVKAAITPMETKLPLTKDEEAFDVDVHLYRSMIGHNPTWDYGIIGIHPLIWKAFSVRDMVVQILTGTTVLKRVMQDQSWAMERKVAQVSLANGMQFGCKNDVVVLLAVDVFKSG